jgi:hypothetical protein
MASAVTDPARLQAVGIGAAFDLTVTVTALYYWLIVRRGLRARGSLVAIAVLGLLRAAFLFPHVVPGKELLAGAAECGLVAAIWRGFRRTPGGDPVERFRVALAGVLPFETAERALAGEFSVLYYAFAWRVKPLVPEGARPFTLHRRSGFADIILCVGLAAGLELLPMHILVHKGSAAMAWVLTALSVYGAVWLTGLYRSLERRPCFVKDGEITLRLGLFFSLTIPADRIAAIGGPADPGDLVLPRGSTPNLRIAFTEPLMADRVFGFRKVVNSVAIASDEAELVCI